MSLIGLNFRRAFVVTAFAVLGAWTLEANSAAAADEAIFAPGQPIVTGFSGVVAPDTVPDGSDPLDYTFIDLDGHSMAILGLEPEGQPEGQLIDAPSVFAATAADVGQVFGITLDNAQQTTDAPAPNIYLAASSAFGLNIVVPDAEGNPMRSASGDPAATYMPGQWGSAGDVEGYPGSIWKVDGTTGEISLFSTIAANTGAGLSGIVFDPSTAQFFVSDLDTGLIYRLAEDGTILDTFDHGMTARPTHDLEAVEDDGIGMDITDPAFNSEDPSTWGITQPERKVTGLAIRGSRLYYATAGLQVWSVRIAADGSFGAPRWELDAADLPSSSDITGIIFDTRGRMLLAQRGPQAGSYDYSVFATAGDSSVARYEREFPDDPATPGLWKETSDSYAIGMAPDGGNATGGIALGPNYNSASESFGGSCNAWLWATGDALRDNLDLDNPLDAPNQISGLQGARRALVRPLNDPPEKAFFVDYDGNTDDEEAAAQGHVGSVAIWQVCEGAPAEDDPPVLPPIDYEPDEDFNLTLEKWASPYQCFDGGVDWWCSYTIRVENTGSVPYWGSVTVDDHLPANNPGAVMHFWPQPPWNCTPTGPTAYSCVTGPELLFPGDAVVLHEVVQLPKAMVAYCHLANVAGIDWPWWLHDQDSSDDFDSGITSILGPGCVLPGGGADLLLNKVTFPATCFDTGLDWICSYLVTVQNTGPGNYSGPIQVKDTLGTNATATTFGPWNCIQVGPVLTCDIIVPPVNVAPGWTSGFFVTAHVPKNIGPPLCDLSNKANIASPAGGSPNNLLPGNDFDQATTHIPDPACLIAAPVTDLEMQKTGLGCFATVYMAVNGYACQWQFTLTNIGPDPYTGPLSFRDTSAGATLDTLTLIAPGTCTGPATNVTCTLPGSITLNPAVPVSVPYYTFYPDGPAVCSATNNISILAPNPGGAENPGGNDAASDSQVLPNPACPPPAAPLLNIQKTALGCASDPSSTDWLCDFEVKVSNLGGGAQPPLIQVTDYSNRPTDFSTPACIPSGLNQWTCTRAVPLNGGSDWTFIATAHVDPAGVTLADCEVVNTVQITNPVNPGDPGYVAQSTQKVPQLFINVGPGPVVVYCDPPSLKLAKTAGKTVKSGDGYDATFTIRATSTGPDPYHGTVELDENLPDGTSFVSSDWTCVPTLANDVHCSSPYKDIPVGKYTQMTIVIHIPTDVAIAGKCDIVNTVNAAISAEVLHSAEGAQYTASAAAKLPANICEKPKQCPIKQVKPDGSCCPDGTSWNGKQCAEPPKACPKDSRSVDGECVCRDGTHGTPGKCKPDVVDLNCPRDSHEAGNKCVCDEGSHGTPGKCKPDVVDLNCPRDSHEAGNKCVCDEGSHGTPGKCKPDVVELSCPRDSHQEGDECVCDEGSHGTPGKCRPDVVELECPRDSHQQGNQCVCDEGSHGTPGKCRPDVVEISCPRDSHADDGICICNKGTHGEPGDCVPDQQITQCPEDSHFDRKAKACVCNAPLVGEPGQCTVELKLRLQ
ncbi:MAG: hypothetical protein ABIO40_07120 [Devosia sp.]